MFISPSVFSPSCAVWASLFPSLRLCATLSIIAIGQLLSKHCNLAAGRCSSRTSNIPNLLMSGTRPPVVSAPAAPAASALGCTGCSVAQLLWLLWLPARLLRLSACPLWLPAFIPYAKVKKLILTHYILFIWKDRSMFFPMRLFVLACCFSLFPMDLPGISIFATAPRPAALPQRPSQQLCHGSASLQSLRHGVPASISASAPLPATSSRWRSATAPLLATNLIRRRKLLRFG